jgi:hypothetical protein
MAKKATPKVDAMPLFRISHEPGHVLSMIANIAERSKALRDDVHTAAVSSSIHCIVHGDTRCINALFDAVGPGFRRAALAKWFNEFAPVRFEKGDKAKGNEAKFVLKPAVRDVLKARYDESSEELIAYIGKVPFWEFSDEEKEFKGFDFKKVLEQAIKRAENYLEKVKEEKVPADKIKVDAKLLAATRALL